MLPVQEDAVGGTHVVDADRISLYVELNVAYKLTVEDTPVLPENEVQVGVRLQQHLLYLYIKVPAETLQKLNNHACQH